MAELNHENAYIGFSGISKTYDGKNFVVKNLDLSIRKGEFLTLLGPSGSGKTTTLMMLAGFEFPTTGEIAVDGRPIQTMAPEKRNIGMVFQNYALFPHMTVAENVGYSLKVRGVAKTEIMRRVFEALSMVRLSEHADRRPTALSGGQQQRVALARALVFEPSLVLMDEPLGALDKKLRENLQLEIRQIADRLGLTVVYVTHDQYEALTMSDRIAIFNDGRIQQIGCAEEIYSRPNNRFVAEFVGDNNCLDATITEIEGGTAVATLAGGHTVRARSTSHARPGAQCTIAIRPESISLQLEPTPDHVLGTIADIIYCGDQLRIHIELDGGSRLIVKSNTPQTSQRVAVGNQVYLYWEPECAWALDGRSVN